ncbi:MAG: ADP-ribosylglycohydrolase family protein [Capsulimonadaceae bacterium]|nr:ADP-ribosylglycohydrolase family protein [Capsulimonadaceae bacterium]
MARIILGREEFRRKVLGCWIGKNVGGTLGTPYECQKGVLSLSFYDPVPTEPLPNDDLDLQLVWLKMLEDRGHDVTVDDFAEYWMKYLSAYPWNEYGFCARNLERGLKPPVSGWFENYYVDEMGSPIRSEIWACLCPADPQRAAALAWMDSAMDHAGGEGTWGEMFWAAVESAAFVESDPLTLIEIGLAMIPPSSDISRVIREAIWCRASGQTWAEARERVVTIFGNNQPCNAIQNHGFTIIGWLYGEDFGDKLCKAVNCSYDTDCTGATLGSVLGIIGGVESIPEKWIAPIGHGIVLHRFTGKFDSPKTVEELTDRTIALAESYVAGVSPDVAFGAATALPPDMLGLLSRTSLAYAASARDVRAATVRTGDATISLHYNGDPVLRPALSREIDITAEYQGQPSPVSDVTVGAPAGWVVTQTGTSRFSVTAPSFDKAVKLTVAAVVAGTQRSAKFTVLSPGEATGYAAAKGVPSCPKCGGRIGACICE